MATATDPYVVGEHCLCYHGPLIYEVKVLKVQYFELSGSPSGIPGPHYFVHYKGWKQTWDEFVAPGRLLKYNEENVRLRDRLKEQREAEIAAAAVASGSHGGAKGKSGTKDGAGARRAKDGVTARGTKRAREDDGDATYHHPRRVEMKLTIPETLKSQLVDDWENVTNKNMLVTLPRSPSVEEILQEFEEHIKKTKPPNVMNMKEPMKTLQTIVTGLRMYFDRALGGHFSYFLWIFLDGLYRDAITVSV
jgi:mortality factor 4-like protein 1